MKLVLFDCDGTLVDSLHLIHGCMASSFEGHGYAAPDAEQTKSVIGLTLDTAIARLLGRDVDAEVVAMTARYKAHFAAIRAEGTSSERMFDGIRALISHLDAREDVVLGVVTGKSRRGLGAVLRLHGLERTFFTMRTADDCPSKPHPAMVTECCREAGIDETDTLVVGDAVFDMQMAAAAGAVGIGVAWGYSTPAALRAAGAKTVIDRPRELLDWIGAPAGAGA